MKSGVLRTAAVLLCASGLMASSALAQQDAPPAPPDGQMQGPPPAGPGGPEGRGNPERRVEMLQRHLSLSTDQTAQMRTIFEGERAKMDALRSNTSLTPEDRRAQMMAIHQDGEAKIHAILTPDQQKRFDEMQARQHERMQERRREGAPGQPPADSSAPPPPPQA